MAMLATRNTLLTEVINVSPVPVAFENNDFDPSGLDAFVAFYFIPVTSASMGKTVQSGDDERGFIQLSVFVKADADDYDNQQLQIIDTLKSTFYNTKTIDNVMIDEVTTNAGSNDDAWFKRDLTINYTVFTARI